MSIEKKLDTSWYQYGYMIGANSRKKIKDLPNKIVNLGDRGISKIPNESQKVSFFIGLLCGRGKIVQNFDVVRLVQYQDKKAHRSKGDYLALEIGKVKGSRGHSVVVPVYVCNNSVDNRGFCGYQAKIKYNQDHLTLTSINSANPSYNFTYQQDAGVLLVQGIRESIGYDDEVVFRMTFTVKNEASDYESLTLSGPSGNGTGSDLFTRIGGELYYIQPITLNSGAVLMDMGMSIEEEASYVDGLIGSEEDSYGAVDLTYDFDMNLVYGGSSSGGSSVGSGGYLVVKVSYGGGLFEYFRIPVEEGSHHYSGKLPSTLPGLKKGPIKITLMFEAENEDDLYYWFIKAGALWGFEDTINREDVGDLEIPEQKRTLHQFLRIYSDYIIYHIAPPQPVITDITISELFKLFSDKEIETYHTTLISLYQSLLLKCGYLVEGTSVPKLTEVEIEEIMNLVGMVGINNVHETLEVVKEVMKLEDNGGNEMKLGSSFTISYE